MKRHAVWGVLVLFAAASAHGADPNRKKARKAAASRPAASQPAEQPRRLLLHGVVFEDANANGHRDPGEPTLPGRSVSDGIGWARTDAGGAFEFTLNESETGSVFVFTPAGWRASRQFYIIADFAAPGGRQSGEIGLIRDEGRNADRFSFVQLTDTHVTASPSTTETMTEDLKVVNRLTDPPAFVVATGDLVNVGAQTKEFEGYLGAIAASRHPYYNVIGNHDYSGRLRQTQNYEQYLGPSHYSFEVGRYHFVAKDIIADSKDGPAARRQQKWLDEDLRLHGQDRRVVVFQHFLPRNDELDFWSEHNGAAVFSGHWHGRHERLYKGILDVNSAPTRFGGIDRSPRGFRIVRVDGDTLDCEWRVGQQERHLEIIQPAAGAAIGGEAVTVQALVYDTAVLARRVGFELELSDAGAGDGDAVERISGELKPAGQWMWSGVVQLPPGKPVRQGRVTVRVGAADNSQWKAESSFHLTGRPQVAPEMTEAWRFFHGDAGHRGYLARGPRPPLSPAWATNVGGTILLASPVIADGTVYVGTGFSRSLGDCAVFALDLATGGVKWRAPVDSSIQHSLAVWEDRVLAVSQAAGLYCFDRQGKPRWEASLAREKNNRWELSFPVTDGKSVYAGRCDGFGAYALETGRPIWNQPGGGDWWPSIYSGPSIGTGMVYQGGPFARALDPATGKVLWNRKETVVSTLAVVPAVVERSEQGDRLYAFQNEKTLLCLDGRTGETIWQANRGESGEAAKTITAPLGNETGTPAVGGNVVCVGGGEVAWPGEPTPTAAMHGFDKQTGRLLWRYAVGTGVVSSIPYKRGESTITSSPVIVGDTVYFGANDGYLYALDANKGTLTWRYRLGVPIASTVAVTGNCVVVAAWDGTIYAFTSESLKGGGS